jgi:hypothetical protein
VEVNDNANVASAIKYLWKDNNVYDSAVKGLAASGTDIIVTVRSERSVLSRILPSRQP